METEKASKTARMVLQDMSILEIYNKALDGGYDFPTGTIYGGFSESGTYSDDEDVERLKEMVLRGKNKDKDFRKLRREGEC